MGLPKTSSRKGKKEKSSVEGAAAKFPRHAVEKALRIPRAIIDQNAGRECTEKESARFVGVGYNGPYRVEVSSALKFGFLERPSAGKIKVTDRARQAIRPQKPGDELAAFRQAVLDAPNIAEVYTHYRGEYLPDDGFFEHALEDKFGIPKDKVVEFKGIFLSSLQSAGLLEKREGKNLIIDVAGSPADPASQLKKLKTDVAVGAGDSCFVLMPFGAPIGDHYTLLYEPAIRKVGLVPVRADAEIFGTGKIIDQIWHGINAAKVLVAELTDRNPNVFYELGLAHALNKPVVLISSNEADVPFDLKHIRVIYYNVKDPFWGQKLMDKVEERELYT